MKVGRHGRALRACDDGLTGQLTAGEHREVQSGGVQRNVKAVDDIADDLAEGKRHDCQIVTAQTKHRDADEDARNACQHAADQHGDQHENRGIADLIPQRGDGNDTGKCADTHEACMAEAQLAGNADHQIQGERHDDVNADRNELAAQGAGQHADGVEKLRHDISRDHGRKGDQVAPGCFGFPKIHSTPHTFS